MKQESRIGIDIGGTFTDLIYQDENGITKAVKVPTTPQNPDEGCLHAIQEAEIPKIEGVSYFLHATTVGLNALLERRGAIVGLLTTEGFRDTLAIGRGDRKEMYNIKWNPPKPLVPRKLRVGIEERILSNGSIRKPLDKSDVRGALAKFKQHKVNAIAVVYLHAYANPEHELETRQILREEGFEGSISLSHLITGEYREFERTSTTVIDAFVSGRMGNYLNQIQDNLRKTQFKGLSLITKSGGGAMTFEDAQDGLCQTIMSGPVAGAEGAAELSNALDLGDLITADVGGTSFDTCIVRNGRPKLKYEGEIIDMPVQMPWVDVRSIGAGGGSIAYVDAGGLLKVGPQSAGADPGPACYGRGGTKPTITDAAFALGMLGEGKLASGLILDKEKSMKSLKSIADTLNTSVETVAQGILRIATSSMANTIREITVENGIDPREMKLLAYGGAGPLFADLILEELQMTDMVLPPFAGNFSAWGLLGTDILYTKSLTKKFDLDNTYGVLLNQLLEKMFSELSVKLVNQQNIVHEVFLDLRYKGQEHTLTLKVSNTEGEVTLPHTALLNQFEEAYHDIYNTNLDNDLEIVSVRVALRKSLSKRAIHNPYQQKTDKTPKKFIKVFSFCEGQIMDFELLDRTQMVEGKTLNGPIILTEGTTTSYIDINTRLFLDRSGCVFVKKKGYE